jgi:hypothetical protein
MDLLIACLQFLKLVLPKAIAIFGVCCGLIEFIVRDQEIDRIRNFFIWIWMRLEVISKLSIMNVVHSKLGRVILDVGAILTTLVINAINLSVLYSYTGSSSEFIWFLISPENELYVYFWGPMLISLGIFYFARGYINDWLSYCLSGTFFDALSRLTIIPLIVWVAFLVLKANNLDRAPLVAITAVAIGGVSLSYLNGIWLLVFALSLVYVPLELLLFLVNRLSLRIAEAKRGPVLAIAAILAIGGALLDVTSATSPPSDRLK